MSPCFAWLVANCFYLFVGKKGLNQLKSFLDSKRDGGGSLREGSERGNAALRNVRAKREAEEAGALLGRSHRPLISTNFIFTPNR